MLELSAPFALALLGFIPGIVALYFMKTRPRRVVVSSNRLWELVLRRRREETILGRFRNSIFLVLHILLVALAALALAQPSRPGGVAGDTLFVVDTSASMGAVDEPGGRLAAAKRRAREIAERLDPASQLALVEAGLRVVPVVPPTKERETFFAALERLSVTDCAGPDPSELASILAANPETRFARTHVFTDNCPVAQLADLGQLGALHVETVGRAAENVGFTGLDITELADGKEIGAQARNFGPLPAHCRVVLTDGAGTTLEAREVTLESGGESIVVFRVGKLLPGALAVRISPTGSPDHFPTDDTAHAVLGEKTRKVLLVDFPDSPLEQVLSAKRLNLEVARIAPAELSVRAAALAGYDVVVANGAWAQELEKRNLLAFASPGGGGPAAGAVLDSPALVFVDATHPVMKYLSWEDVQVKRAAALTRRGTPLVSAAAGDLVAAFDAGGARQVIAGFALGDTDLAYRVAFPIFVANALAWIAGTEGMARSGHRAGETVRLPGREQRAVVTTGGQTLTVNPARQGDELVLDVFRRAGIVEVKTDLAAGRYAVNLFSLAESNIKPSAESHPEEEPGADRRGKRPVWRELMWAFLALLLLEWFLWHRLGG